jgi:hypothetical protein
MPKQRGPYKKYIYNPESYAMPYSSFRQKHKNTDNNIPDLALNRQSSTLVFDMNRDINNTSVLAFNSIHENQSTNDEPLQNSNQAVSESDESHDEGTQLEGMTEIRNVFEDNAINSQELAAAYLAAFYSGKITQHSLTSFLTLSNIHSSHKLPTTFDGLIKSLDNDHRLVYQKTWYCGTCLKAIQTTMKERNCGKCQSK